MKWASPWRAAPLVATTVWLCVCSAMPSDAAPQQAAQKPDASAGARTPEVLPDIGTKMPDGTVYAGLSMTTGKPSYVAAAGRKMPDSSIFAGFSPDQNKDLYTTAADAPGVYTWASAVEYCKTLSALGHQDWRVPSIIELAVEFANRAEIGGFNETGSMVKATGYYWSSLLVGDHDAWAQRFNDGFHEDLDKSDNSSARCVR